MQHLEQKNTEIKKSVNIRVVIDIFYRNYYHNNNNEKKILL